jgi:hypothetical protein
MKNNPLFDHISNNYNVNLLESDQDAIKRICRAQCDADSDATLGELHKYLSSEHNLFLPDFQLQKIVAICLLTDDYDPDPEPLKFYRPMTKEVLIVIIEDSRAHVLNRPKYFCCKLKDYIKLKREQRKYKRIINEK